MTAPPEARPHVSNRLPLRRLLVGAFVASTALLLVSGFLELETPGWAFTVATAPTAALTRS